MEDTKLVCGGCGQDTPPEKQVSTTLSESAPYVSECCRVEVIDKILYRERREDVPLPVG